MRPSTFALTTMAAAASAQNLASLSQLAASLTTDPAYSSLVASYQSVFATADPTSLLNSLQGGASSALGELSDLAATATGSQGAYYSGLYTSAAALLSSADAAGSSLTAGTGTNAGNGAQQTSGATSGGSGNNDNDNSDSNDSSDSQQSSSAGAESQSGNGAAATAVPIAMGAVGMAVLGFL